MTHKHYSATLYKRAKTGKIVYWKVWVEPTDRTPSAIIFKETGQLGTTSPTIHKDLISEGKNLGRSNETTPLEQATFQAQSDFKKKQDDGYKSLVDLRISLVPVSENRRIWSVGVEPGHKDFPLTSFEENSLHLALDLKLPKSNTTAVGLPLPMLATDWNKVKSIPYPVIVQPKLDGVRCLLIIKDGTITFLSRKGKPYTTMTHIEDRIRKHPAFLDADAILDGELYAHTDVMTFQDVVSAIKKKKESTKLIKFRMYDIVSEDSQMDRLRTAFDIAHEFDFDLISYVGHTIVESKEKVVIAHNQYIEQGYEGAIIRFIDGSYGKGQRSRELLKVKVFDDAEFEFKNFEFGKRGVEDLIAVCLAECGTKEFRAKMEGSLADKKALYNKYEQGNLEGYALTVKYFGLTDGGIPRFPNGKAFRENGG